MHSGANRCLYACSRLVSILMPDRNKHIKRTKKNQSVFRRYLLIYFELVTLAVQKQKLPICSVVQGQLLLEITEETKTNISGTLLPLKSH